MGLVYLLNQLNPHKCPLDPLNESDELARAESMINNSNDLGVVPPVVGPEDIIKGNR